MKFTKALFIALFVGALSAGCQSTQDINALKVPGKMIEAGTCTFGAKSAQHAAITTRSDCDLRGGAFAPDIDPTKDESAVEIL